jgi:hypothetical protein
MPQNYAKCERYETRIKEFTEVLFDTVWFELLREKNAIEISLQDDLTKCCNLSIRELMDQQETRLKIAGIAGLIIPHMEDADYYEFAQRVLNKAHILATIFEYHWSDAQREAYERCLAAQTESAEEALQPAPHKD